MHSLIVKKPITIALSDFALPVPRNGSIEAHSGYGRSAVDGQEIHVRVQKKRAKADPLYKAEVPASCLLEREGYLFRIDGRMDGVFRHELPKIVEIKSSFNIRELARRLSANSMDHPYNIAPGKLRLPGGDERRMVLNILVCYIGIMSL